tara:strand:- start:3135 stop:3635 length:501 start_codon:yes stop_codon:yes gene_type:complete
MPKEVRIEIPNFITHVAKTNTKYIKINGQRLYTGMNHHLRALIVRRMHRYIQQHIPNGLDIRDMGPIKLKLELHTVINHGDIRMYKGELRWRQPKEDYKPKWDVDNLWIWIKSFQDTIVEMGLIDDDNCATIPQTGEIEFIPVPTIDDRKLVFIITPYKSRKTKKK